MADIKEPLVSVIVASYNYEKYIGKTLESLVGQTYKNIEIIVVDDGSRDGSLDIINKYVKQYPNVFLYTHPGNENHGLSATLQLALGKCRGKWIAFCESDDYYLPDNIEEKIQLADRDKDAALVVNEIQWVGDTVWDRRYMDFTYRMLVKNRKNVFKYFTPNLLVVTFSSVMIRADVLRGLDFNTPVGPWLDFWLWRQVAFDNKIALLRRPLNVFVRHPESYIAREKASRLEQGRRDFLKASDAFLRRRHPLTFLWRRYGPYLFGTTEYVDYKKWWFMGIPVVTVKNSFLPPDTVEYTTYIFGIKVRRSKKSVQF